MKDIEGTGVRSPPPPPPSSMTHSPSKSGLLGQIMRDQNPVCSSLVAHLAAVASTRVRSPASCQILYLHKVKLRDGERTLHTLETKKSFLKHPVRLDF